MQDPAKLLEMSNEELCELYMQTRELEDQVYAQKKTIREELTERLKEADKDGEIAGKYSVTRFTTVRFKTKLEQAEELGAVKTQKKVDTTKLRKLHEAGVEVPGTTITEDVRVNEVEEV